MPPSIARFLTPSVSARVGLLTLAFATQLGSQSVFGWQAPGVHERMLRDDTNGDGRVSATEFSGPPALFKRLDRNGDNALTAEDFPPPPQRGRFQVPADLQVERDVVFGKGGGRDLKLHIVLPKIRSQEKRPAYVWIHGGGWQAGNKEGGIRQVARVAQRGFIGATIEYRLTGEAPFPAQIEDCKCAIRYLRAHAEKYHIDVERIAVGGSSAGGHLVALLGTSGGVSDLEGQGGWSEQSSAVQAVVDLYGPTDFAKFVTTPGYESHDRDGSPESKLLGGGPVSPNHEGIRRVNPITYVDAADPAFLIIHGSQDPVVPMNQSQALYDALMGAGVKAKLHIIDGAKHGGPEFAQPEIQDMIDQFLTETVGRSQH